MRAPVLSRCVAIVLLSAGCSGVQPYQLGTGPLPACTDCRRPIADYEALLHAFGYARDAPGPRPGWHAQWWRTRGEAVDVIVVDFNRSREGGGSSPTGVLRITVIGRTWIQGSDGLRETRPSEALRRDVDTIVGALREVFLQREAR